MVLLAKGSLVVICIAICILSTVYAQAPAVLSTTRAPVLGGRIHIYGRNFGNDASKINVQIADLSGNSIECTNVAIIAPDRVIACQVSAKGTGKSMHVTVTVSTTNADGEAVAVNNDDDNNAAFSRDVPTLDSLTFSVATKTIMLSGSNFGDDTSKISVVLDGNDYPVLAADNNAITLRLLKKRREQDYTIPETSYAYVTIDGQSNAANMSVSLASPAVVTDGTPESGGVTDISEGQKTEGGSDTSKIVGLAVGGAFVLVVVSIFVAAFVMRRKKQAVTSQGGPSNQSSGKPPPLHVYNSEAAKTALDMAHIGVLHDLEAAALKESRSPVIGSQKSPLMEAPKSPVVKAQEPSAAQEEDATTPTSAAEVETTSDAAVMVAAIPREHSDDHHSFEEIALHEDIYEKNDGDLSDSSFSESSDEEDDSIDGSSSLSAGEFSESSPAHTPTGGRKNMLQLSSEFPSGSPSPKIQQAPSPPMLVGKRTAAHPLPNSSLRRSTIPPSLYLDGDGSSSEGSPLPSPRTISPGSKGKKKKTSKKGMVRVPSSRLASSGGISKTTQQNVFDSPKL